MGDTMRFEFVEQGVEGGVLEVGMEISKCLNITELRLLTHTKFVG